MSYGDFWMALTHNLFWYVWGLFAIGRDPLSLFHTWIHEQKRREEHEIKLVMCRCCTAFRSAESKPWCKPRKVSSNKCISDHTTHRGSCRLYAWCHCCNPTCLWLAVGQWGNHGRHCWCGNCSLRVWIDFCKEWQMCTCMLKYCILLPCVCLLTPWNWLSCISKGGQKRPTGPGYRFIIKNTCNWSYDVLWKK